MESAKLRAEHQFILDCARIIEERNIGGRFDHKARYKELYGHVETLGRNLAAFVVEHDNPDKIKGYVELFAIGLSPDAYIESPLDFIEREFYECGESVQEVTEVIIPDNIDIPETDDARIMEAFRAGVEAGLTSSW
jgi:hypothetical protein